MLGRRFIADRTQAFFSVGLPSAILSQCLMFPNDSLVKSSIFLYVANGA